MTQQQLTLTVAALFFLFLFFQIARLTKNIRKNAKLRRNIASGKILSYADFEENWIITDSGKHGNSGYKYNDGPGCYVITVYSKNRRMNRKNYMKYENVYVGQSVHICQRVHNHFNGKGNGNVYADIKYGKSVYVRLVPCRRTQMNELEKELIEAFHATASYNETKGGGKKR